MKRKVPPKVNLFSDANPGAFAAVLALAGAYLVSLLGLPFGPLSFGQALIEILPGWVSIPIIEALKHLAQPLLILGVLASFVIAGGVSSVLETRSSVRTRYLGTFIGVLPWALTVILAQMFAPRAVPWLSNLVDCALGAAIFLTRVALKVPPSVSYGPDLMRRRLLLSSAAVLTTLALVGSGLGALAQGTRSRGAGVVRGVRRLMYADVVTAPDPNLEGVRITPRLTSTADHYTVDTTLTKPFVDVASWTLSIEGNVERPYVLTYEELLDLPAYEYVHTLECISNEVGGELISTSVWTGVRLKDLLERAGVKDSSNKIILQSVDGYTDSITLAKALDERCLVAYLMNETTLPQDHGFPVRVLVPDIYGMKNVKWLSSIRATPLDYKGYWMIRGWDDMANVRTNTRIDSPQGTLNWSGQSVRIAGIAFAGQRGVKRVEVSTNGGVSWLEARREQPPGKLAWTRWYVDWQPSSKGRYALQARATDGMGALETANNAPPFPKGATGYSKQAITLT